MARRLSAQKTLPKEQETSTMDLENPNQSLTHCLKFMKKLVVVSISSIAFLRGIFPSDAFQKKKLAGERVYVLHGTEDVPGTKTFVEWIKQGFNLVETHHLKKLMLVIQKKSVTLEVYTFSFSYNHDEINIDVREGEKVIAEQSQGLPNDIAKSVKQTIRSILLHTTSLYPLPNDCEISIKLFVDENVPEPLVSGAFKLSDEELNFPGEVEKLKLGKVESRYTTIGLSAQCIQNEEDNNEINQETVLQEDSDDVPASPSPRGSTQGTSFMPKLSQARRLSPPYNKERTNNSNSTNLSEKISLVSLQEKIVRCICESSEVGDQSIKCSSCSTYQHKVCYKLLEGHQIDAHICVDCHDPEHGKPCSVPELLEEDNKKQCARYRQALVYCSNNNQVSCKRLMTQLKVTRRVAERLFQKLDADGCLDTAINRGFTRGVKEDVIERVMARHFNKPPSNNSTDSTCMETENSSSVTVLNELLCNQKRPLDEDKENFGSQPSPPQRKRRKILTTVRSLKKSPMI